MKIVMKVGQGEFWCGGTQVPGAGEGLLLAALSLCEAAGGAEG